MLRLFLYAALAILMTGCPSAMVGTAVLGTSFADERTIGTQIDDMSIVSKIQARLAAEKDMPSRWVSVDAIEGKVSLIGYLRNQEQINRAVFIAKSFQGVKSVHSEIKVGDPSFKGVMTDSWITTKVKSRLLQDPKTSGVSVHVETIDGRVYLQGLVRNEAQYQRAIDITSKTKGVTEVVDMLKINPHGLKGEPRKNQVGKHYGTRKKHGSKSRPVKAAKAVASPYVKPNTAVALPYAKKYPVTPIAITLPRHAKPEVSPLLDQQAQGDIFEETVSGIKDRHKKIKPYQPYAGYQGKKVKQQPVHAWKLHEQKKPSDYRDYKYKKELLEEKESYDDSLKSSEKNAVKQKNSLWK